MDVILKLHEKGELERLSITTLKDKLSKSESGQSFFDYGDKLVQDLIEAGQIGNARSYKGVISILRTFHKKKDLSFDEITYKFLIDL